MHILTDQSIKQKGQLTLQIYLKKENKNQKTNIFCNSLVGMTELMNLF